MASMLRRWVLGFIVLAFGIASWAVALVRVQGHGRKLSHIDVASLHLSSVDGRPLDAHALQGKAVVLNFWAPWCPPCRMEMPWLRKLQKDDQARLVVLGVVADPAEYEHAATLMQTGRAGYPFVKESPELVHELGKPNSLPTSLYISPDGTIIHAVQGVPPESTMFAYARDAEK
jgi:thiol-disulfide isomerase/thioredoxin